LAFDRRWSRAATTLPTAALRLLLGGSRGFDFTNTSGRDLGSGRCVLDHRRGDLLHLALCRRFIDDADGEQLGRRAFETAASAARPSRTHTKSRRLHA
jgi:hypothetical protein